MNILDFDTNIYEEINKCESFEQLISLTAALADTFVCWQKILNDKLLNIEN